MNEYKYIYKYIYDLTYAMSLLALFTIFTDIAFFACEAGISGRSHITSRALAALNSGKADGTDASFDALAIA